MIFKLPSFNHPLAGSNSSSARMVSIHKFANIGSESADIFSSSLGKICKYTLVLDKFFFVKTIF